jgi:hypothetical protein
MVAGSREEIMSLLTTRHKSDVQWQDSQLRLRVDKRFKQVRNSFRLKVSHPDCIDKNLIDSLIES